MTASAAWSAIPTRWIRSGAIQRVNVAAAAAIQAALGDLDHLNGYLRQVAESKALLYAKSDRLGLEHVNSD